MFIGRQPNRGPNIREACEFIEPASALRTNALGEPIGEDAQGPSEPVVHTGRYCAYLPTRSSERETGDESIVSVTPAAIILRWEELMDRVNANWHVRVLGKLFSVLAEPEPYIQARRFVRIQIRRGS